MSRLISIQSVCNHCAVLFICFSFASSFRFHILNKRSIKLEKSRVKREETDIELGKNYLVNYGYMPPGSLHNEGDGTAKLRSWRKALTSMQEFMGMEPSGVLNEETLAMMKRPRCGNPDKDSISANLKRKRRYVKVDAKWKKNTITYSINNYTPKLGKELTHEAIDDAFAVWARHSPLKFRKVSIYDNPDIITFFAEGFHNDNTPFDGPGGFLAHAYYPGLGIGGDTHFDGAEEWTLHKEPYQGSDLFLVAIHELGHALGLGHSADPKAIMAPVYKYHPTRSFRLPQDDINGIQSIYGRPGSATQPPIKPRTTRRPPTTTIPSTTTTVSTTHRIVPTRSWKPRRPTRPTTSTTTTKTTRPPRPVLCDLQRYDAVSFLRQELYVFSGEYMWRRLRGDDVIQGPYTIASFWPELRNGVNAVYENEVDNNIVFFKDHLYWEYDGLSLKKHSPRPVRFYGLQNEHVGAAVFWERNGKTYLFQGSFYWRIDGTRAEKDYPKHIRNWYGVPSNIDAAFPGEGADGLNHTYFVKGTQYWKLDNWKVEVIGEPRSFREDWLGCPPGENIQDDIETAHQVQFTRSPAFLIGMSAGVGTLIIIVIVVIVWSRRTNQKKEPFSGVVTTSVPLYNSEFNETPNSRKDFGPKNMYVGMAQQKWRWLRFSLQHKV